jgi:glucose-6-phosphate 1-dehydrogenase
MDPAPLTLTIFGASGDLTARKLIPALFRLDRKGRLAPETRILGAARSPFSDDAFRDRLAAAVREHAGADWADDAWRSFARRIAYVAADAAKPGGLKSLSDKLNELDGGRPGRRLFYLAVGPDLYADIADQVGAMHTGAASAGTSWPRLIIEKPFGRDLASARELNRRLRVHYREEQLYRIDHYLGKETVQNILVFRFANILFETLWNNKYIDHVQITVTESVPVGSRGDYYDRSGVLRDMFQNHLLQVLTLIAMEAPARFAADPLRNEKVKVLDAIHVCAPEEACQNVVTGQYAGYRSEKGVAKDSRTPTFAAVELGIDNWRWRGVPFFLRSGKALAGRLSEVVVQFHCPPHLMFPLPRGHTLECNRLSLCIQPDEGVHVNFQTKVPDEDGVQLRPAELEFHYADAYGGKELPEAYERLLQDAMHGDAALFMRSDEIERAWEVMDPIIAAVERNDAPPPQEYAVGSEGPRCAEEMLAKTGRSWLSLCKH